MIFKLPLFEIHVDPSLKSISFADIENENLIKSEEEVIFNRNSIFKIHSVQFDSRLKLWKIQLNTTDEGLQKVQDYLKLAKQPMEIYSPIIYFGRLLLDELGQVDRAKEYFEMLLKSLPSDHPDIGSVYNNIGNVHDERNELNLALKNYEIGYEIRRKRLTPDHSQIAGSFNSIANIQQRKGNYDLALEYYKKSLKIDERNYPDDHVQKAVRIKNIGLVYTDENVFNTVLDHHSHALQMYKRILSDQHLKIVTCLGNIGYVHERKGDFTVALDYYHQQLGMQEQCLSFDHPYLSSTLDAIVYCYKKMSDIEKGLEFCREKLRDQKNRLGENQPGIPRILKIMGDVIMNHDRNKSLQYYEEALSILENCIPPDYRTNSVCLKWMAGVYGDNDMVEDALRCLFKALDLSRKTLSSDHVEIAEILNLIGFGYKQMKNRSEALIQIIKMLNNLKKTL